MPKRETTVTFSKSISEQLTLLSHEQTDFAQGSRAIHAEIGPTRVTCDLSALGTVGCEFLHLTVASTQLADATTERVQEIATSLSKKLTYLLEPIATVETDENGCAVQLRSQPPHRTEDSRSYYEVLVRRGGQISLRRFVKSNGTVREETPASVTREVLLRLVTDLTAAVDT